MKNYLVRCLPVFLFFSLCVRVVFAFEEEHEAHEHGHATLMLVQEQDELQLVFKSPAMNIVGFEHQANSPEQFSKLEWAKQSLSEAARLFLINQSAECVFEHVDIKSTLLEADDHSDEHDNHMQADHTAAGENEGSHSEFEAEYHFKCANISKLKEIRVTLFDVFPSLEEVESHIITHSGQTLRELDRHNVSIEL